MSLTCDGVISEFTKKCEKSKTSSNSKGSLACESVVNFPPATGFKGFEKIPVVLVARHDIRRYLKHGENEILNEKRINDVHVKKILNGCSVQLKRDSVSLLTEESLRRSKEVLRTLSSDSEFEMVDPKVAVKCKICEKLYPTEKKLLKHQDKKHMIVYEKPKKRVSFSDHVIIHEVQEYHKCRKCPKIFKEYKFLKAHSRQHHKKRKCYICNYCSKKFLDRVFFKVHIKLHCDACGLLLPNKKKYLQHRHDVCRILKKYECKICRDLYFQYMDLKDHSFEHIGTCYVCDVCKERFNTKCAVSHHFKFLHSGHRPRSLYRILNIGTERLYLCRFCDESSVDKTIIEKHVQELPDLSNRAMTGYKDFYFCDQCLRKFDSETEMLQHKWSHFLKTSDNTQVQLQSILANKKPKKIVYKVTDELPNHMKPVVLLERLNFDNMQKWPDNDSITSETTNTPDTIAISDNSLKETNTQTKTKKSVDTKIKTSLLKPHVFNVDAKTFDAATGEIKKAIVDPWSKKTIVSKHQCVTCGKYYSSNYCLNRHIETVHNNFDRLHCKVCEETFVWPSLLKSHKCIRLNHPELPFDDARPEIHFENYNEQNVFDDFNISYNDDYMNSVDFEIPAPIVELTESDNVIVPNDAIVNDVTKGCPTSGYKLVISEVPIEF